MPPKFSGSEFNLLFAILVEQALHARGERELPPDTPEIGIPIAVQGWETLRDLFRWYVEVGKLPAKAVPALGDPN